MKIIALDSNGVVHRIEREIRDWSTLDYEYVCEDMSDYITNDCVVIIYNEKVFDK